MDTPVTATDRITYSLSGADAASFVIDGATGQIATVADVSYDSETKSSCSVSVDATVPISLYAVALHVSKDAPQNGWGNTPGAGYEHRRNVRRNNGKLVHEGSNTVTLTLETGDLHGRSGGRLRQLCHQRRAVIGDASKTVGKNGTGRRKECRQKRSFLRGSDCYHGTCRANLRNRLGDVGYGERPSLIGRSGYDGGRGIPFRPQAWFKP